MQAQFGTAAIDGEECLNLNVWTPDLGRAELPVLVWIHGGAFTRGANSHPWYDGTAFARDGVVLVSINYRLGVEGFAVLDGAPSNRGLRDQLLALTWVQDNISAFGGDPRNVTVAGESAGAISIGALLAAPSALGLFERAIMQSGNSSAVGTAEDGAKVSAEVAAHLGIRATAAEFGDIEPAQLQKAQDAVHTALVADPDPQRWGESVTGRIFGMMSMFPVVDDLIPEVPFDLLASGRRRVPLIVGSTVEEFRMYTVPNGMAALIDERVLSALLTRYGIDSAVVGSYAAYRPGATPGDLLAAILTDHVFRSDVLAVAAMNPVSYVYEFGWPTTEDGLGACHAIELPFVFDTLGFAHAATGPNPPQSVADEMHRAWVDFATHGDPGWPRYRADSPVLQTFDAPHSSIGVVRAADELTALQRAVLEHH